MFAGQRIAAPRGSERESAIAGGRKFPFREFMANKPWTRVRFPRVFALAVRHPRDAALTIGITGAIVAIVANTLFMQSGPHPAPIFAIRPLPVVSRESTGTVNQLPRPRPATADARKPDAAPRIDPVPLPRPRAPIALAANRPDPIADLLNPTRQLSAVQRALNDFGYGPVKVTGTFDEDTREGIERFERDHSVAVTGQNTPRLRHALSVATGRPLD